jgi:hypothetical protein
MPTILGFTEVHSHHGQVIGLGPASGLDGILSEVLGREMGELVDTTTRAMTLGSTN